MNRKTVVWIALASLTMVGAVMEATAQQMGGGMGQGGMTGQGGMGQGGMMGQGSHGAMMGQGGQGAMMGQPGDAMAEGVIRKVDKDAGKLTIKHGAIPNMDMPPMTMVYRVKDPAMLDQVKAGDAVSFTMEKIGGQFTVTRIAAGK